MSTQHFFRGAEKHWLCAQERWDKAFACREKKWCACILSLWQQYLDNCCYMIDTAPLWFTIFCFCFFFDIRARGMWMHPGQDKRKWVVVMSPAPLLKSLDFQLEALGAAPQKEQSPGCRRGERLKRLKENVTLRIKKAMSTQALTCYLR